jgi:predicted dehydrogenase
MRLLVFGYSSIVARRVISAAAKNAAIERISIASKSQPEPKEDWPKRGAFFSDYESALQEGGADLVYLSLPNSMHEYWVMKALAAGKHVIVDKPAMMTRASAACAVGEARRHELMLAEATVFSYHPLFAKLAAFVEDNGPLTHAVAQFIIPPLPLINFRNHPELGGGCLLDMGPYAAGLVRLLGGGDLSHITALAGGRHPETGVDMGFSVQARLANGGIFSGHFSFEGEYQNRLLVVTRSGSVIVDRIFSPPADYRMEWCQRVQNSEDVVVFEPADTFALFLRAVTAAIASDDREPFYSDLLADADCREYIARALAV